VVTVSFGPCRWISRYGNIIRDDLCDHFTFVVRNYGGVRHADAQGLGFRVYGLRFRV